MKKQLKNSILFLLFPILIFANDLDGKYSKQKTIKKAYIVNPDAGIDIKNSYGNVTVTTWDENKLELDITIKVSGDSESWVDKRLEDITVDIDALKNAVTAITKISKSESGGGRNNSMEINYIIKIPKNGSVKIINSYGSIITSDLFANVNLVCKYGKIKLAKLNGNTNLIHIDYCPASSIESLKNATINADYSGLTINDYSRINLSADYSTIDFGNGSDLRYDCNYGTIKIGKLNTLDGNGDYLTIKIDALTGSLKVKTKYSKISVSEIAAKFDNINVVSGYTAVDMDYNAAAAFNFEVLTKYANFKYDPTLEITSRQENNNTKSYQGFSKKGADNRIFISAEYGNVNLSKK